MKEAVQKASGPEVLIHFSVRDTGIGISQQNISRLFQSFSQVPPCATPLATPLVKALCFKLCCGADLATLFKPQRQLLTRQS